MKDKNYPALIFDLGGVVIDIDINLAFQNWAKISELSASEMLDRFKMDPAYKKHETGEISWDDYAEHLRQSLQLHGSNEEILNGWNSVLKEKVPDVVEAIRSIRKKTNCSLLSNSNLAHQTFWEIKYEAFLPLFSNVFVSSEIGLRKPDPDCFEYLLAKLNVDAGDALFFDDTFENVVAARQSGIESIHVKSPDDVVSKLCELELL